MPLIQNDIWDKVDDIYIDKADSKDGRHFELAGDETLVDRRSDVYRAEGRIWREACPVQWDITSGKAHPDPSATWVPVLLKVTLLRHVLLHSHGPCLWRLEVRERCARHGRALWHKTHTP